MDEGCDIRAHLACHDEMNGTKLKKTSHLHVLDLELTCSASPISLSLVDVLCFALDTLVRVHLDTRSHRQQSS